MGCIFSKPKISPKQSKYETTNYKPANKVNADGNTNPQAKKIVKMKSFQSKKAQPNKPSRKVDHSDSDWAIYLDEFRNPYFFNAITGTSDWNIPPEIATWPEFANMGYVTAVVTIPSDAAPGINILKILTFIIT